MSYCLGADKKSFDIFKTTCNIAKKIGKELKKKGWTYNKDEYCYEKGNRVVTLDVSDSHITSLYISDESIDYERFCDKYTSFEPIYGAKDEICEVETYISKDTNIMSIVSKIENAPLIKKEKEYQM